MFAFPVTKAEETKSELEKYLPHDQMTLFEEVKKLSFNPKTFDAYTKLFKDYSMEATPASHLLILREQTRTMNDKNLQTFIGHVQDAYDIFMSVVVVNQTYPQEFKVSLEKFLISIIQKVERFTQKNVDMLQSMVPLVSHIMSSLPPHILTPYHALLAHIQFAVKDYKAGREMYKQKYHGVAPTMTTETLQLYLYYAGAMAMFNRDMEDSYFLFDQCVLLPTKEVTPQLLASWKKVSLISLIVHHLPYRIKKNVVLEVFVEYYPEGEVYKKISESFINSPEKLSYCINVYGEQLMKDGNFGLSKQVEISYIYSGIRKVSKAYNSIRIGDFARRIKLDEKEFERNMKKLIEGKHIKGHIDGDVYYFAPMEVETGDMERLMKELKEAEEIFTEMRNHLTQREEERDVKLVAEMEKKEAK